MKIVNKKRFTIACILFILILVIIIGLIIGYVKNKDRQGIPTSSTVLTVDKLGSINLNEDNFYKTYIINCKRDMKDVKWKETKDWYKITLGMDDVENLNINIGNEGLTEDIYYEKKGKNTIVYVKKSFENGNSLKVNKQDSKKIIVLIDKTSKIYKYKIVVDAGHGGEDKGSSYDKLYEKDITLKIARYIEKYLNSKDCQVIMTRDTDKFVFLNSIAELNNYASPDAFISIHIDSNKDVKCKGVSTYYYYNAAGYQKDERMNLSKTIKEQMLKDDSWNDMGIRTDHLLVLSKSDVVSALIECGFITNSSDRAKLTNNDVLERLGKNISEGVLKYLNTSKNVKK